MQSEKNDLCISQKKNNAFAPVLVFAYNRPDHLIRTLDSLAQNDHAKDTELYIFSDGAAKESDQEAVSRVRKIIDSFRGFKRINRVFRDSNFGLADNIIDGVSTVLQSFCQAIILEDDMVSSRYFLSYMNQGLRLYENEARVAGIHGYIYPRCPGLPRSFFLRGADCWGWATWRRAWDHFEPDGKKLLEEIKAGNLEDEFNFGGAFDYTGMLQDWVKGRNNSWAVRWYASAFLKDMLTLYPGVSLIRNIGLDGSGEHCAATDSLDVRLQDHRITLEKIEAVEDGQARKIVARGLLKSRSRLQAFKRRLSGMSRQISLRSAAKAILPPVIPAAFRSYRNRGYGCSGDYSSWQDAAKLADGYDAGGILKEVYQSARKVRDHEGIYERDGVLFDQIQYSWPLLSGILLAASQKKSLQVIDFGGSLGTTYYQNKKFLDKIQLGSWNIIEQSNFVELGRREFSSPQLHFYDSMEACLAEVVPDLLILSSVLQYVENYEELLAPMLARTPPDYILVDRTPFSTEDRNIITVQKVRPEIYQGSYVCRLLSESGLKVFMRACGYQCLESFVSLSDTRKYRELGFIFEKLGGC